MSSTPEDDVNIVKQIKDLEYYTNLVDKTVAGFEKFGSNLEKVILWLLLVRKENFFYSSKFFRLSKN